jgi:hypothetical protein
MVSGVCIFLALCGSLCCTYASPIPEVLFERDSVICIDAFDRKTILSEGCSRGTGLTCTNNCRTQQYEHVLTIPALRSRLEKRFESWKLQLQDLQKTAQQSVAEAAFEKKKIDFNSGAYEYFYPWQQPAKNGSYRVNPTPHNPAQTTQEHFANCPAAVLTSTRVV